MEFSLLAAVAVAAVAVGVSLAVIHRTDPPLRRITIDLAIIGILAGIGAGRVWAMAAAGTNPLTHPADLLIVRGGVDTFAAAGAGLAAVAWAGRHDGWHALDALAPGVVFGLAGWHAGCVMRRACLGTPTGLPWGWATTPGGVGRHPIELYAALLFVVVGVAVVWLWRHRPGTGLAAATALFGAAAARALTEPLRPVIGSGRTIGYLVAAGLAAIVAAIVLWRTRQPPANS
jgi:prolipoprotein diacylglyceryltransferase